MKKITLCAFACTLILLGCSEGSSTLKAGFSIFDNGDTNLGKMLFATSNGLAVMTNKDFIVGLNWKGEIGGVLEGNSSELHYTKADCTGVAYETVGGGRGGNRYEKTVSVIQKSSTEKSLYKNKTTDAKEVTLLSTKVYGDNPETEAEEDASSETCIMNYDSKTVVDGVVTSSTPPSPSHALELEPTTRAEIGLPETIQAPLTIKNN